jgi:hypothetical protein
MDFSFESLRPGEVVIWNGQMGKQQRDAVIRPAPPIREQSRPRMCGTRDECADVGAFKVSDERVIKSLRTKWGIE